MNLKQHFVFFFLIISFLAEGQSLDELLGQLEDRIYQWDSLNAIGINDSILYTQIDSLYGSALDQAIARSSDSVKLFFNTMGDFYLRWGHYEKAAISFQKTTHPLFDYGSGQFNEENGWAYLGLGSSNNNLGHFVVAYDYFIKADSVFQLHNNTHGILETKLDHGILKRKLLMYTEAMDDYNEVIKTCSDPASTISPRLRQELTYDAMNSLSVIYKYQSEYQKAFVVAERAKNLTNNPRQMCSLDLIMGSIDLDRDMIESARKRLMAALGCIDLLQPHQQATLFKDIGKYFLKINQRDSALAYARRAVEKANNHQLFSEKVDSYDLMSEIGRRYGIDTLTYRYFVKKDSSMAHFLQNYGEFRTKEFELKNQTGSAKRSYENLLNTSILVLLSAVVIITIVSIQNLNGLYRRITRLQEIIIQLKSLNEKVK